MTRPVPNVDPPRVEAWFQSHGGVLLIDGEGSIAHATPGCNALLGKTSQSLVRSHLSDVFRSWRSLAIPASATDAAVWSRVTAVNGTKVSVRPFAATHSLTGLDILPSGRAAPAGEPHTVERIAGWTSRLNAARDRTELVKIAAAETTSLSGVEGAWVVRIEPDGRGFVEAASVFGTAPDTTGSVVAATHLPPGDLSAGGQPVPFFVADVGVAPHRLEPELAGNIEMGESTLGRPFGHYLDFLASIGVRAAFSIPIVVDGQTWGRVIGHDPSAMALDVMRQAELRLLGEAVGQRLKTVLAQELSGQRGRLGVSSAKVLRSVAEAPSLSDGLRGAPSALLELCGASSAIIAIQDETAVLGAALPPAFVRDALQACRMRFAGKDAPVIASSSMPFATDGHAGGYLAMRFDESATDLVMWIRPKERRTVQWVAIADNGPASSLEEAVSKIERPDTDSIEPWSPVHEQAVRSLRADIASLLLERYVPLRSADRPLSAADVEVDAFAHTVAHELRAPIRAIRQYVEFLVEDAAPRLAARDLTQLRNVLRLSDRGISLLDDLAMYAELGRTAWSPQTLDLATTSRIAIDQLDPAAVAGAVIEIAEGSIVADPAAFERLLADLIGNAMKFSAQREAHVRVGIQTLAEARSVSQPTPRVRELPDHTPVLVVADGGVGIAPEHAARVFGLFRRANESLPELDGNGAGLAICRRIAQRHGGDIWLTSTPGRGTTVFTILAAQPPCPPGLGPAA